MMRTMAGPSILDDIRRARPDLRLLTEPAETEDYRKDETDFIPFGQPLAVAFPSSTDDVSAIVRACAEQGVPVVARGGGSGLDLGKCVAFMQGQTRPVWDFEDIGDYWTRADPDGIAPIVAVPTTAGTGSEVGRASVITNSADHVKKVIFHPKSLPEIVICDPELLCPRR